MTDDGIIEKFGRAVSSCTLNTIDESCLTIHPVPNSDAFIDCIKFCYLSSESSKHPSGLSGRVASKQLGVLVNDSVLHRVLGNCAKSIAAGKVYVELNCTNFHFKLNFMLII